MPPQPAPPVGGAPSGAPSSEDPPDVEVSLKETLDKVRTTAEKAGLKLPPAPSETTSEGSEKGIGPLEREAVALFAALCKFSPRDNGSAPAPGGDSQGIRNQRTILELMIGMLQKCGPALRSGEGIFVIKQSFCSSIIMNSVSSSAQISDIALRSFLLLMWNYKENLKAEIGIFLDEIVIRILESGNSTYHHKFRALQVFYKLCADASIALELFLNYDCNVDEKNIFERIVDCVSKISQGKYTDPEHVALIQPNQEKDLRMLALKTLVTLMGSLLEWARRSQSLKASTQPRTSDADEGGGTGGTSDAEVVHAVEARVATGHLMGEVPLSSLVEQKQRKRELQNGVSKFNLKPKRGIEHLRQGGFLSDDPVTMAEFFKNQDLGLDKTAVGDFLGEDKTFNKSVLDALVEGLEFAGEELDGALRTFLGIFRLPGEAQKISRMMEKFAEKYCMDNPGKFSGQDCAFVLSFSLIMLQTDLHNPGVKRKMSKDEFVNNNRGINDGGNLPREYLELLYDSVAKNPISLKEDVDAKAKLESQAAQGAAQKSELFLREAQTLAQRAQDLINNKLSRSGPNNKFVSAKSAEHARPLFEVAYFPMLATLSVLMEKHDEPAVVEQCLQGFKHCIRISVCFDIGTERDAIVQSLAKFTYLSTIKEMRPKNVECLKALFEIGLSEGNGLGQAWSYVLHCVSELERLQLISLRARQDFQYFAGADEGGAGGGGGGPSGQHALKRQPYGTDFRGPILSMSPEDRQIELVNSESVCAQIDVSQIDLIFSRSTSLESTAIVHFVTQLARVSREELALIDQPRIFGLQKLVEVTASNLSRVSSPPVWSKVWHAVSQHFVKVACHRNVRVGMYAVDSMRQLALKYLENEELIRTSLQAEFLRPFEEVMGKPGASREVKELIVSSVSHLAQTNLLQNVKSGWKAVFNILYAAVHEQGNEASPECAFDVMEKIVDHHYGVFVENFSHGVRALTAFGQCQANVSISLQAMAYLQRAAQHLADKTSAIPLQTAKEDASAENTDLRLTHWFLILRGLGALVKDPRPGVRAAALTGVFHCLRDHGSNTFDEAAWRSMHEDFIKPLFEAVHGQLLHGDESLVPIVSGVVLRGLKDLPPRTFAKCLPEVFPLLSKLVAVSSADVRSVVQEILLEQVQPLLIAAALEPSTIAKK